MQDVLRSRVLRELEAVLDPELGINIVDLGLVYAVIVDEGRVRVDLTMTTPACPLGETLVSEVRQRVTAQGGIQPNELEIRLVWDPPWGPERMSTRARQELGWNA